MTVAPTATASLVEQALSRTAVTLVFQGSDNRFRWAVNLPRPWQEEDVVGRKEVEIFAPGELADLRRAKLQALKTGNYQRLEVSLATDGALRWFEVFIDPQYDPGGEYIGVLYTGIDITDQKRREVTLKNLLREVSHRSKNLLAIMLGIASQTARSSTSIDEFLRRFTGRVQSISRSQDIITEGDWIGATLHHLCGEQVNPYLRDNASQFSISGENILLTPHAAMYVGLALHELATNAANFGALSGPEGHVVLSVDVERTEHGPNSARLIWLETGVARSDQPRIPSFGQKTLEKIVPMAVEGQGILGFTEDGVRYELSIDRSQFS